MNAFNDGGLSVSVAVMTGKPGVVPEKFRVADAVLFAVSQILIRDALEHLGFHEDMLFERAENSQHTDRFVAAGEKSIDFLLSNRRAGLFDQVFEGRLLCCAEQVTVQFSFRDGREKRHMLSCHRSGKRGVRDKGRVIFTHEFSPRKTKKRRCAHRLLAL